MSDMTINERLATVEEQIRNMKEDADKREAKQDDILSKLDAIILDSKGMKSFMGGAMWVGMAMVGVLWKIGPWIVDFIRAKTGNG